LPVTVPAAGVTDQAETVMPEVEAPQAHTTSPLAVLPGVSNAVPLSLGLAALP
jgi:hypothetical protein